jgi:sugar lactone lactonase YvrE
MLSRRQILAAVAGGATSAVTGATAAHANPFGHRMPTRRAGSPPTRLALPTGFQPEGLAVSGGPHAFVTSLANGDVYKLDLLTGAGQVLTRGPGTYSAGVEADDYGRLFVVGAGIATVIRADTGATLATYRIAAEDGFLNDVLVTGDGAYITDSSLPMLYRIPLGRGGRLPAQSDVARIPLNGDFTYHEGWNASGIELTPDRSALLVAQSNTGQLHRVDPTSGIATRVHLGGETLVGADGILLIGRTLYVVQGGTNLLSVVRLNATGTTGRLMGQRTDPRFDLPTSVARFGNRLYLPNARVGIPSPETAQYDVVALPL